MAGLKIFAKKEGRRKIGDLSRNRGLLYHIEVFQEISHDAV